MKIYVDLLFLLNVWIDFLLLYSVAIILKRVVSFYRIIIASLFGGITTFLIFFQIDSFHFFIIKFIICCIMLFISFSFRNFLENLFYFYLVSIILAGFIYMIKINIEISDFFANFIMLIIFTPVVLYFYNFKVKKVSNYYNYLYNVKLYYSNNIYNFTAFLDTGNKLYDPYKKRPIVLLFSNEIAFDYSKGFLVPYETANSKNLLKCLKAEKMIIDNKVIKKNIVFGLVDKEFNLGEVNMILHSDFIGG